MLGAYLISGPQLVHYHIGVFAEHPKPLRRTEEVKLTTAECAHVDKKQHCGLLIRSKKVEVDLRERVAARADHVGAVGNDKLAGMPDPVRKRLAFLLSKWERLLRDIESELTTCGAPDCSRKLA